MERLRVQSRPQPTDTRIDTLRVLISGSSETPVNDPDEEFVAQVWTSCPVPSSVSRAPKRRGTNSNGIFEIESLSYACK